MFLVTSVSVRAAPAPDGGEPPPPHTQGFKGEGRIVVVEDNKAEELTVGQLGDG